MPRCATVLVRADDRPLREFNENCDKLSAGGEAREGKKEEPGFLYADENPPVGGRSDPGWKGRAKEAG